MTRAAGLVFSIAYATLIVWLYAAQPQTVREVTGGLASSVGAYQVDAVALADGLSFFRRERFDEARAAFARADPARRDAKVQFYIAYSFYRQGWGRLYHDDRLYTQGLAAARRAADLAGGVAHADDGRLHLRTSDELIAELERGRTREASDADPRRLLERRK